MKFTLKTLALLLLVLLSVESCHALTVSNGITTLGNINLTEDIIIESSGTLIIAGNLTFGHPNDPSLQYHIRINNGGSLSSNGGSIHGLNTSTGQRTWQGIILEATSGDTSHAIYVKDFSIMHALRAIKVTPLNGSVFRTPKSRKIHVENTAFADCGRFLDVGGFSRDHGINSITFKNCSFVNPNTGWPFWVRDHRYLVVEDCFFNYGNTSYSSELTIHFNSVRDVQIKNCRFYNTGRVNIVFHGASLNIDISNNDFDFNGGKNWQAGIAVGYQVSGGTADGATFSGNYFYGPSDIKAYGIVVGDGINNGAFGHLSNANIKNNTFWSVQYPICLTQAAHAVPPSPINICGNNFDIYKSAVYLSGGNTETYLSCNTMETGDVGLMITDIMLGTDVKNWDYEDPNNQFVGSLLDIDNQTNNNFIAYTSSLNPHPLMSFNGPVIPSSTFDINGCTGESGEYKMSSQLPKIVDLEVYPNPSQGRFTLTGSETFPHLNTLVEVKDISGKTIYKRLHPQLNNHSIDLEGVVPGAYVILVSNQEIQWSDRIMIE